MTTAPFFITPPDLLLQIRYTSPMEPLNLDDNPLLCGADRTAVIVAAELTGRFVRLFIRSDHGVTFQDDPFHPFILVENPALLATIPISHTSQPLAGDAPYRH